MPDMLVKLYDLPDPAPVLEALAAGGIAIRRAGGADRKALEAWLLARFESWWPEAERALGLDPVACFLAFDGDALLGFACYDVAAKNFFGPTGVDAAARGRGIGKGLLLTVLAEQRAQGYGYSIIGGVGPAEFYEKAVGATLIPGSDPGIYGKE